MSLPPTQEKHELLTTRATDLQQTKQMACVVPRRQSVYPPTLFGSAPDAGCHTEFGKRSLSGGTKPLPGSTIPPGCGGSGPVLAP